MRGQYSQRLIMTYAEQLQIIKDIPLREGDTKVITCPFCGGQKKLAISKIDGKLMWNCYRASCEGKGIHTGKRDLQSAKNYLTGQIRKREVYVRPLPSITTSVENHKPALDYLASVNSLEAYRNGYIKVRYDPSEDRVLFYSGEGVVAKSLRSYGPKWMTLGSIPAGVHIGTGTTAVLVEDVPSACSVSRVNGLVGVAMLGTNITKALNKATEKYLNKYLCLDKDASAKAIVIKRQLGANLKVRFISKDLKVLTTSQIRHTLKIDL